jgi:hypothetical protein
MRTRCAGGVMAPSARQQRAGRRLRAPYVLQRPAGGVAGRVVNPLQHLPPLGHLAEYRVLLVQGLQLLARGDVELGGVAVRARACRGGAGSLAAVRAGSAQPRRARVAGGQPWGMGTSCGTHWPSPPCPSSCASGAGAARPRRSAPASRTARQTQTPRRAPCWWDPPSAPESCSGRCRTGSCCSTSSCTACGGDARGGAVSGGGGGRGRPEAGAGAAAGAAHLRKFVHALGQSSVNRSMTMSPLDVSIKTDIWGSCARPGVTARWARCSSAHGEARHDKLIIYM